MGLTEFMIPVILDGNIIAYLLCGQIVDKKPTASDWKKAHGRAKGMNLDFKALKRNFLRTRVIPRQTQEYLMQLLELFANYIADAGSQMMLAEKFRKSRLATMANKFIADHATENISLTDVARETFTSKRNLIRILKLQTGMGVRETINRVRIERARDLLKDSSKQISLTALDCGYKSVQQFIRVFKRVTGTTPRKWRAQCAQQHGY
jgi:AraC-like DNA-binding protein